MQEHAVLPASPGFARALPAQAGFFVDSTLPEGEALVVEDIGLRHLRSSAEIERVLHLREHIDLSLHTEIDPRFEAHERLRDECGFVGAFEWRGAVIGTIRVVPMDRGLTLTEDLLAGTGQPVEAHGWEVGRLVLAPEYRTNYDALRQCLYLSVSYLHAHARVDGLYASCSHALGRLYRRFGFTALAHEVALAGTSKSYTLIRSEPARVISALRPRTPSN